MRAGDLSKLPPGTHRDAGGLRLIVKPDPRGLASRVTLLGPARDDQLHPVQPRAGLNSALTLERRAARCSRFGGQHARARSDCGPEGATRKEGHFRQGPVCVQPERLGRPSLLVRFKIQHGADLAAQIFKRIGFND